MALTANERGVEIMAISIEGKAWGTYEGLAGTFAGFADSCLRHKTLPGFYRTDLTVEAELKGRRLQLVLPGERTPAELVERPGRAESAAWTRSPIWERTSAATASLAWAGASGSCATAERQHAKASPRVVKWTARPASRHRVPPLTTNSRPINFITGIRFIVLGY